MEMTMERNEKGEWEIKEAVKKTLRTLGENGKEKNEWKSEGGSKMVGKECKRLEN